MNNINDCLLLELNRWEQVQLSGQINGKPISSKTRIALKNFTKEANRPSKDELTHTKERYARQYFGPAFGINSPDRERKLQQQYEIAKKQGVQPQKVRNLGQRVADRDNEAIAVKQRMLSQRAGSNAIDRFADNPVTGTGLNVAGKFLLGTIHPTLSTVGYAPGLIPGLIAGTAKKMNSDYYQSGQYSSDHKLLQSIRQKQRESKRHNGYVDPKTKESFKKADPRALDKTGQTLKKVYSPIPRRDRADDYTTYDNVNDLMTDMFHNAYSKASDFKHNLDYKRSMNLKHFRQFLKRHRLDRAIDEFKGDMSNVAHSIKSTPSKLRQLTMGDILKASNKLKWWKTNAITKDGHKRINFMPHWLSKDIMTFANLGSHGTKLASDYLTGNLAHSGNSVKHIRNFAYKKDNESYRNYLNRLFHGMVIPNVTAKLAMSGLSGLTSL